MTTSGSSRSQIKKCGTLPVARSMATASTVKIGVRRSRSAAGRLDLDMQELVDLMMKDQRQAGDAQHQQEQHADEAGPFVNP